MPERRCSLQYTWTVPVLHYTAFVLWANTFAYGQRDLFVLHQYTGESVLFRHQTPEYGSGALSEESVMLAFRHPRVFSPCTCFYSVAFTSFLRVCFFTAIYIALYTIHIICIHQCWLPQGEISHTKNPPVRFRCLRLIPVMCSCRTCAFSATSLGQWDRTGPGGKMIEGFRRSLL